MSKIIHALRIESEYIADSGVFVAGGSLAVRNSASLGSPDKRPQDGIVKDANFWKFHWPKLLIWWVCRQALAFHWTGDESGIPVAVQAQCTDEHVTLQSEEILLPLSCANLLSSQSCALTPEALLCAMSEAGFQEKDAAQFCWEYAGWHLRSCCLRWSCDTSTESRHGLWSPFLDSQTVTTGSGIALFRCGTDHC